MQIIFDTSRDSKLDMLAGIAALQAYMATYHGAAPVTGAHPQRRDTDHRPACDVGQFAQPVRMTSDAKCPVVIQDPIVAAVLDPVFVKDAPVSFQPGDMSGSAPSPAVAAPSPTAPEAPQDGVPMPPTVATVPAPPSTAPVAPAVPSTSAPSGELDVNGLPWDERIHASSKTRNADGSWRQRRNLSPVTLETVMAELRGAPVATAAQVFAGTVPPPPVVATPPAPAAPDALTYDGFLAWVTPKMMDGSTPFDKVAAALSASGVSSLQELRDNPAAIPSVYTALGGV